ncbi:MAG: metallophosphoesterase, partial [Oscillospiraceae bacterium]|nr:metallophosphoesterase [Oscillospiraceae bacterium]
MKTRIPLKLLAALTALCLLLSFGAFSAAADEAPETGDAQSVAQVGTLDKALASGLAFDASGDFKILVMNDLDDGIIPYPAMLKYIESVIADEQPDLIVLNGNITRGGVSVFMANFAVIPWICNLFGDIPFTLTFGKTDALLPVSKNHYLTNYQKYSNCLAYDDAPINAGVANHNLFIFNDDVAAGDKSLDGVAFNLYLLDSNKDGFYRPQAEWYGMKEYDLIKEATDYVVPSLMFSHLPLPEINLALPGEGLGDTHYNVYANTMYQQIKNGGKDGVRNADMRGGVMAVVSGSHPSALFDTEDDYVDTDVLRGADPFPLRFIQRPGMSFLTCSDTNRDTRGASIITLHLDTEAIPATPAVLD